MPLLALHLLNSHTEAIVVCTANCHLRGKREINGAQGRTKVSFGRTMMQALELLRLTKRHVSGRSNNEQWKNQACSLAIIELRLSKGIS